MSQNWDWLGIPNHFPKCVHTRKTWSKYPMLENLEWRMKVSLWDFSLWIPATLVCILFDFSLYISSMNTKHFHEKCSSGSSLLWPFNWSTTTNLLPDGCLFSKWMCWVFSCTWSDKGLHVVQQTVATAPLRWQSTAFLLLKSQLYVPYFSIWSPSLRCQTVLLASKIVMGNHFPKIPFCIYKTITSS